MLKKKMPNLTKPVIGIAGTIILGAIGSLIANLIWGINIQMIFIRFFVWIKSLLIISIPLWVFIIVLLIYTMIIVLKKYQKPKKPEWLQFRKIEHSDYIFIWDYAGGTEITNVYNVCKNCGCKLTSDICPICNKRQKYFFNDSNNSKIHSELQSIVDWNINTDNYKKYI
jgi:predicted membrane protein